MTDSVQIERCLPYLSKILDLFLDPTTDIKDDTYVEKLLGWVEDCCRCQSNLNMLCQHASIGRFIDRVVWALNADEVLPPVTVPFTLRFLGTCSAERAVFGRYLGSGVLNAIFLKVPETVDLWREGSVRSAWFRGLCSLNRHDDGARWLFQDLFTDIAVRSLSDNSIFVIKSAENLLKSLMTFAPAPESDSPDPSPAPGPTTIRSKQEELRDRLTVLLTGRDSSDHSVRMSIFAVINDILESDPMRRWVDSNRLWSTQRLGPICVEVLRSSNDARMISVSLKLIGNLIRTVSFGDIETSLMLVVDLTGRALYNHAIRLTSQIILNSSSSESLQESARSRSCRLMVSPVTAVYRSILAYRDEKIEENGLGFETNEITDIVIKFQTMIDSPGDSKQLESALVTAFVCLSSCLEAGRLLTDVDDILNMTSTILSQVSDRWWLCDIALRIRKNSKLINSAILTLTKACQHHREAINQSTITSISNSLLKLLLSNNVDKRSVEKALGTFETLLGPARTVSDRSVIFLRPVSALTIPAVPNMYNSAAGSPGTTGLGSVIVKLLTDPAWEVRDSAITFVESVVSKCSDHEIVLSWLREHGLLKRICLSLEHDESYLRASVYKVLTSTMKIPLTDVKLLFQQANKSSDELIINVILKSLENDTEAIVRRVAAKSVLSLTHALLHPIVMTSVSGEPGPRVRDTPFDRPEKVTGAILEQFRRSLASDLDWEVKIEAFRFWMSILETSEGPEIDPRPATTGGGDTSAWGGPFTTVSEYLVGNGVLSDMARMTQDCDPAVAKHACEHWARVEVRTKRFREDRPPDPVESVPPDGPRPDVDRFLPFSSVSDFFAFLDGFDIARQLSLAGTSSDLYVSDPVTLLQDIINIDCNSTPDSQDNTKDCY